MPERRSPWKPTDLQVQVTTGLTLLGALAGADSTWANALIGAGVMFGLCFALYLVSVWMEARSDA